jgi:DNA-binding transcriptional ArsR family regulator
MLTQTEKADILKCIAHPVKLEVLHLLKSHDSLCVGEIQDLLGCGCEQSMLSHHLIKMQDKGILKAVKKGKQRHYELHMPYVVELIKHI